MVGGYPGENKSGESTINQSSFVPHILSGPFGPLILVYAEAIKVRGIWIPAANGRSQIDGRQLLQIYPKRGLHLKTATTRVRRESPPTPALNDS